MFSVCIIMKNEEKYIEECLKRLIPLGCPIYIADTGSTDKSLDIALKYTPNVYKFEWINDFSAARNFIADKAETDFVLMLDCDEYIEKADIKAINSTIIKNPKAVFCPLIINKYESNGQILKEHEIIPRLYNKKYSYYEYSIHEQLKNKDNSPLNYIDIPIEILHLGYFLSEDEKNKKSERNLKLLKAELEKSPNDPYLYYQIGKSYYMIKDYTLAEINLFNGLSLEPDLSLEYTSDMVESYGYCLLNNKKYKDALDFLDIYDGCFDDADFDFLAGLIYMNNSMFKEAVIRFLTATQKPKFHVEGTNSYSAFYNIGVIFECCKQPDTAIEYYKLCGDFKPALDGIKRLS